MCLGFAVCCAATALGQTSQPDSTDAAKPAKGDATTGVIKGSNVYIRSGFSTNYYPVVKLNHGDSVKIDGEEYGWLKIVPPAGTYSLIEKTYIDRVGDKKGVANGSTWAFAGSNLDDRRYAKQVKLNKGDAVQIVGETSDGAFFKIEPPAGAHLWIKADLVDRGGLARAESPNAPALETVKPGQMKQNEAGAAAEPKKSGAVTEVNHTHAQLDKFQSEIDALEGEIAAESTKPLGERSFDAIIPKLQPIAEQSDDEVSQIYAKTRIQQLQGQKDLADAVKNIRTLHDTAIDTANTEASRRAQIRTQAPIPLDDIVLRGEIRVSGIYDGAANRPKRWRVVDPENTRTLAYIEVPEGSPIDPVQYYGKSVGIRASAHRQLKNTIPPVPVYTIKEIVMQDAGAKAEAPGNALASPPSVPVIVATPSSQPADSAEPPAEPATK
jgi:hypothetical protein